MNDEIRDPYRGWKIIAIVLAGCVIILSLMALLVQANISVIFTALLLGAAMCAVSGVMALVKGRRVLGYLCSVLAGVFLVLLIIWAARIFW